MKTLQERAQLALEEIKPILKKHKVDISIIPQLAKLDGVNGYVLQGAWNFIELTEDEKKITPANGN